MNRLIATALVLLLVMPAVPAQTNRAPYASAGPDITTPSSPGGGLPPVQVLLDARIEEDDFGNPPQSFDPDEDTLACFWDVRSSSPNPAPGLVFSSTTTCEVTVTIPSMPNSAVLRYDYQIVLFVYDGRVAGSASPDHAQGITCYSPAASMYFPARMCDSLALTVLQRTAPPEFASPAFSLTPSAGIDLVVNRRDTVVMRAAGVRDDFETRTLELIFEGPNRFTVPLTKVAPAPSASPARPEISTWEAQMPVTDPRWRVGTYNVIAEARDAQNAVTRTDDEETPFDFQYEVSAGSEIGGQLRLDVVDHGLVTTEFTNQYCLNVEDAAPQGYVLGPGQTLRLEVVWPVVTDDTSVPGDVFRGPVTMQSFTKVGTEDRRGPVIELPQPYYVSLSGLSYEDQTIRFEATDRLGNEASLCIYLGVDTNAPLYVPDVPAVTYRDIPFPIALLTRESTRTVASLRVDNYGYPEVYEKSIDGSLPSLPPGLESARLPQFGQGRDVFVMAFDADPALPSAATRPCDIMLDLFEPYGVFDNVLRPSTWTIYPLFAMGRADAETTPDYAVDFNKNNQIDDGSGPTGYADYIVPGGTPESPFATKNRCRDPFAGKPEVRGFLNDGPTQLFVWRLVRSDTDVATTTFAIQDLTHNRVATDYVYNFTLSGVAAYSIPISLNSAFITRVAEVDAKFTKDNLNKAHVRVGGVHKPASGETFCPQTVGDAFLAPQPVMVGDKMCYLAGFKQTSVLIPPPTVPVTLAFTDQAGRVHFREIKSLEADEEAVLFGSKMLLAGQYIVNVTLTPLSVEDTAPADNLRTVTVEVFAGRVDDRVASPAKQYFIRALSPGVVRLADGAVTLKPDGSIEKKYELRYNTTLTRIDGEMVGARYEFTVPDGSGNRTLYWNPHAQYSMKYNKDCTKLTADEAKVDRQAEPPKDPECRPVTVHTSGTEDKKTPAPTALWVALAFLGVALWVSRRR